MAVTKFFSNAVRYGAMFGTPVFIIATVAFVVFIIAGLATTSLAASVYMYAYCSTSTGKLVWIDYHTTTREVSLVTNHR